MARKLVLFGNGAVAEVLHHQFSRHTDYEIAGFTVDREFVGDGRCCGVPVVPWDDVAEVFPPDQHELMIAIGYVRVNRLRAERFHEAREMGYRLASYVHPRASLWDGLILGENCRINENVIIQPFARIGDNVFIGAGSLIGHHTLISDHCHLSAGVHLAGQVEVGPYCYFGIHSTVRNRVKVAPRCVIGAGAVLLGDTVERGVYMALAAERLPIDSDRLQPA
jgi:sugar O-acyltransferase (sialic acid O-acetyltransferase NeuD family)